MLFYSYHFCIFSLFSRTILKQFFTYFKPIILKQKIVDGCCPVVQEKEIFPLGK